MKRCFYISDKPAAAALFGVLFILLLPSRAVSANVVAVLEIVPNANVEELSVDEVRHLTDNLRVEATKALPASHGFSVLTRDGLLALLPPDEEEAECLAEGCAVDIGRVIGAEYISSGVISKFAGKLALTVELYETMGGKLLGSFSTEVPDVSSILDVIRKESPALFAKINLPTASPPPDPLSLAIVLG